MLSDFNLEPTNAKSVLPGQVFGRLFVVETGQVPGTYRYMAICQCMCCSPQKAIRFDGLTNGVVVSCGCVQRERSTTHGLTQSAHYNRWTNMMDRCYNAKCAAYDNYGGRGIAVCVPWQTVENYMAGLPDGYFHGAHLDRIDNDGDYEPNNARWVTPQQNFNNRRSGVMLTYNGKTLSLTDWSHEVNIPRQVISNRIDTWGWSIEQALTTPPLSADERMARARNARWGNHIKKLAPPPRNIPTVEYHGATLTLDQLSAICDIPKKMLYKRIFERGWAVDKAIQPVNSRR